MEWFDDIKKYYVFRILIKRYPLPIIAIYMIDVGLSVEQIALVLSISTLISLIFEIPSGAFADGIGHKRALIISMIGQSLSMGLFIGGTFWWILAASVVYWSSASLMSGTMQALFFERLKVLGRSSEHRKLDGRAKSFSQGFGILFMATAGLLYVWHSWIPFIFGIIQFILAGIVISTFGKTEKTSAIKFDFYSLTIAQIVGAFKVLKQQRLIAVVLFANTIFAGASYANHNFDQIVLRNLGFTAVIIGFVYVGKRVIGMLAPLVVHRLENRVDDLTVIGILMFLISGCAISLGVITNPWLWSISLYVIMASVIMFGIISNDYINQRVNNKTRATLLSFGASIGGLVKFLAMSGVSVMLGWMSLQIALMMLGVILFFIAIVIVLSIYLLKTNQRKYI